MVAKLNLIFLYILCAFHLKSQHQIKLKREDNRFLFYQIGVKNDTILKNKSDLFFIKIPDSLSSYHKIMIENAKFNRTNKFNTYLLVPINGMQYSHTIQDTLIETLVEGISSDSKNITLTIKNTRTSKIILSNKFIVK
jgi:hypothetical protein